MIQRLLHTVKLNTIMASALLLVGVAAFAVHSPAHVFALNANQQAICDSIGSGTNCGASNKGGSDVNGVLKTIINLFTAIVGVIAVIMVIIAGFKYITSGGDSAKLTSAKGTLVYALVGIAIVALAQAIVRFVLSKTT